MALPKSWQAELSRRVTWIEEGIASLLEAASDPVAEPVEAVLDDETTETEGLLSASAVVPVTVVLKPSLDFDGELVIDIKLGEAAEWIAWIEATSGPLWVPAGAEVRARLASIVEGSVEVVLLQGAVPEPVEEEEGEGEGGEP